jgi:hypothetical protein
VPQLLHVKLARALRHQFLRRAAGFDEIALVFLP